MIDDGDLVANDHHGESPLDPDKRINSRKNAEKKRQERLMDCGPRLTLRSDCPRARMIPAPKIVKQRIEGSSHFGRKKTFDFESNLSISTFIRRSRPRRSGPCQIESGKTFQSLTKKTSKIMTVRKSTRSSQVCPAAAKAARPQKSVLQKALDVMSLLLSRVL